MSVKLRMLLSPILLQLIDLPMLPLSGLKFRLSCFIQVKKTMLNDAGRSSPHMAIDASNHCVSRWLKTEDS